MRYRKTVFPPETTDDREGFIHPVRIQGTVEKTEIDFIIRDFETDHLEAHETFLRRIMDKVLAKHHGAKATLKVTEQYRNMKEVLVNHPEVTANAADDIRRAGVQPWRMSIRGGTDGPACRLWALHALIFLPVKWRFTANMNT